MQYAENGQADGTERYGDGGLGCGYGDVADGFRYSYGCQCYFAAGAEFFLLGGKGGDGVGLPGLM